MSTTPDGAWSPGPSPSVIGHIDRVFGDARLPYDDQGLAEAGLTAADLAPTPLAQFRRWYDDARAAAVIEPNAMTLATVGPDGLPTARTVLLKHADAEGFVFFTNHTSRKGTELAANPVAALVLPWLPLHRQVCARGLVAPIAAAATAEYFGTRPWGSRIGAWASHQSRTVPDRAGFEARWAELARRWPDRGRPDDVPVPPHWGGYVVRPLEVEFWQGRPSRLHDRLVYRPVARSGASDPSGSDGRSDRDEPMVDVDPPRLDGAGQWRVERREP